MAQAVSYALVLTTRDLQELSAARDQMQPRVVTILAVMLSFYGLQLRPQPPRPRFDAKAKGAIRSCAVVSAAGLRESPAFGWLCLEEWQARQQLREGNRGGFGCDSFRTAGEGGER